MVNLPERDNSVQKKDVDRGPFWLNTKTEFPAENVDIQNLSNYPKNSNKASRKIQIAMRIPNITIA